MADSEQVAVHAYGIQPEVLNSWERFSRFFIENCGYGKGRVIAAIPSKNEWMNRVKVACEKAGMKPSRRKSVSERMVRYGDRFYELDSDVGDSIRSDVEWVQQALSVKPQVPLRLILSDQEHADGDIQEVGNIDDTGPWHVEASGMVERSVQAFEKLCGLMLKQSRRIKFVDPYLHIESQVFRALLPMAWKGKEPRGVELHVTAKSGLAAVETAQAALQDVVPDGQKLIVQNWGVDGADRMHDRFLLTDLGGVTTGWGFDREDASVTHASLMTASGADQWKKILREGNERWERIGEPFEVWGIGQ
jgi:hypothetical protein